MILVCYDISANALRTRISKRLLEAGLERINRSVFLGELNDTVLKHLTAYLRQAMEKAEKDDSLIILPVTQHQVWQMEVLGNNILDIPVLTGQEHTIIM